MNYSNDFDRHNIPHSMQEVARQGDIRGAGLIGDGARMTEVAEESKRNVDLLEQLCDAINHLQERLVPVLSSDQKVLNEAPVAKPMPQRNSPIGNMLQARNERLEQVICRICRITGDLAI